MKAVGPPGRSYPLHRQVVTGGLPAAASAAASRSAWASVWASISPPCGARTSSPVATPSSSTRSTNSPSRRASASERVGCGTRAKTRAGNSAAGPNRARPILPTRTTSSGDSSRDSLTVNNTAPTPSALDADLLAHLPANRAEPVGVDRAVLPAGRQVGLVRERYRHQTGEGGPTDPGLPTRRGVGPSRSGPGPTPPRPLRGRGPSQGRTDRPTCVSWPSPQTVAGSDFCCKILWRKNTPKGHGEGGLRRVG